MSSNESLPPCLSFDAKPYAFTFPPRQCALLVIDMQRDFICPGGFGEIQGGNLESVKASIAPTRELLDAFRQAGLAVIHTREGHVPDLSDCPSSKLIRQAASPVNSQHLKVIGDVGKMGRLLVRGNYGHDLVDELQPLPGEVVIDKPGKGAFWSTDLMHKLKARGITHLVVCGVTTECCFSTTIREANDRGFECCGIADATAGYNASFKAPTLDMISWSEGLFGFIGSLQSVVEVLRPYSNLPLRKDTMTPPHTPQAWDGLLDISSLQTSYQAGLSPVTVMDGLSERIKNYQKKDPAVWIRLVSKDELQRSATDLIKRFPDRNSLPPLYGIPFSVKDSIDIAGIPTTTACPALTHIPSRSAPSYERLLEQGAIFVGKTNLDQLATGLSGCRSPYGIPRSVYNPEYVSGGSSSGNCVSVGANLVCFSLATDTAGSGRVPAGFNGVVGYKPTRGIISARGVTPACLSLDCVALITRTVSDARTVWQICEGYDEEDRYARVAFPPIKPVHALGSRSQSFSFGIPPAEALTACSPIYRRKFNETVKLLQSLGGTLRSTDWAPFDSAGRLLYDGTLVSERLASLPDGWLDKNKEHLHPVIREIFEKVVARQSTAVEAYRDMQAKALYTRQATSQFGSHTPSSSLLFSPSLLTTLTPTIDVLVVPTAPTHPTVKAVLADPIALNSLLGTFTHFGNVLDLNAIAVPAGRYSTRELESGMAEVESKPRNGPAGAESELPFSITFLGAAGTDAEVLWVAELFERAVVESL
ncbi:hypothetical protein MMC17_003546 [Xylographa soralifera]|nr:hypothetical protein [Xylographa soralifera]